MTELHQLPAVFADGDVPDALRLRQEIRESLAHILDGRDRRLAMMRRSAEYPGELTWIGGGCDICEENAAASPIGDQDDWPNPGPPCHPGCDCEVEWSYTGPTDDGEPVVGDLPVDDLSTVELLDPEQVWSRDGLEAVAERAELPDDTDTHEFFYHSARYSSDVDSMVDGGITNKGSADIFLSKDEIRGDNGFVIVKLEKGAATEGVDRVAPGETYRQWTVPKVPSESVVRGVRAIKDSAVAGSTIREDELARYLLDTANPPAGEADGLPAAYRRWYDAAKKAGK